MCFQKLLMKSEKLRLCRRGDSVQELSSDLNLSTYFDCFINKHGQKSTASIEFALSQVKKTRLTAEKMLQTDVPPLLYHSPCPCSCCFYIIFYGNTGNVCYLSAGTWFTCRVSEMQPLYSIHCSIWLICKILQNWDVVLVTNYLPLPDLFTLKNKYRFNNILQRAPTAWDLEGQFHEERYTETWRAPSTDNVTSYGSLEAGCRKARLVGQKGPLNYCTLPQPLCKCQESGCGSGVDRYRCSHQISESWCGFWFLVVAMHSFYSHSSVHFIVLETSPQELKLKNACEFPMLVLPLLWVWLCGEWVWMNQVLIPLPNQSPCRDRCGTSVRMPEQLLTLLSWLQRLNSSTGRLNELTLVPYIVYFEADWCMMKSIYSSEYSLEGKWCVHCVCVDIHACLYMTVNSCF